MKIIVDYVYPPIPVRIFDYVAYYDGCEEEGPYGYGRTKQEAIDELREASE